MFELFGGHFLIKIIIDYAHRQETNSLRLSLKAESIVSVVMGFLPSNPPNKSQPLFWQELETVHFQRQKVKPLRPRHETKGEIMLNDDTLALSKRHSINDAQIQGSSVRRQIEAQVAIIADRNRAIKAAQETIFDATSDIQLAEQTISFLKGLGISGISTHSNEIKTEKNLEPSIKQMVAGIIIETIESKGIMTSEIKNLISQKYDRSVSATTIDGKIQELIKEGTIYQTNEGSQRGKRYLAK